MELSGKSSANPLQQNTGREQTQGTQIIRFPLVAQEQGMAAATQYECGVCGKENLKPPKYLTMKKEHLKFVIDSRCFRGSCVTSMSDGIHCDYYGSTLEELKKQENNPFLIAVTKNAIHKRSRIHDKSLCRPFREITEENYYNCMNELPPVRLKRHSFFFGEPYHGSLYMFCFTIGKRFFRGLRPVMTPQAELERQMNEHYRNITFKGKVTKGKAERITSKDKQETITIPYSFTDKENRERFICNMVTGGNDGGDTCKARKDMANILLSLRKLP